MTISDAPICGITEDSRGVIYYQNTFIIHATPHTCHIVPNNLNKYRNDSLNLFVFIICNLC
jgi:hypothetical protein